MKIYCVRFLALTLVLISLVYILYSICDARKGSFFCNIVAPKRVTYILAFGDSLTRGYVSPSTGRRDHPYSKILSKTLKYLHSKDDIFIVDNYGKAGEQALGTAQERLTAALRRRFYKWVIILTGTNDLAAYTKYEDSRKRFHNDTVFITSLFSKIKTLSDMAMHTGARVLLGTIFSRQCEEQLKNKRCDKLANNRKILNTKIRYYVLDTKDLLILVDFDREFPYKEMTQQQKQLYWQDDVHFTEAGYERMAKLIYTTMFPYLPERHYIRPEP